MPTVRLRDLQVVHRRVSDLTAYPKNARQHSPKQIASLAENIKTLGWTNPVIIDEHNMTLCGHGRLAAARRLGMQEVPCIVLEGLTETQKKTLVISDNQLGLTSTWNEELLAMELGELHEDGVSLDMVGFDAKMLEKLLGGVGELPPDEPKGERQPVRCPECGHSFTP